MNHNPLYDLIDLSYVQTQLIKQPILSYHIDQQWKTIECAIKLDDFLKCASEIAPEYQYTAMSACCHVAEKYMGPQKLAM